MSKKVKRTPLELFEIPIQIETVRQYSNIRILCGLCHPRRSRTVLWNPDKKSVDERASVYLEGHLRSVHNIKLAPEVIRKFIDDVKPPAKPEAPKQTEPSKPPCNIPFAFSPYRNRL